MPSRTEQVEVSCIIIHETEKAWLVETGDLDQDNNPLRVWLPKSQCEESEDGGAMLVPRWLAEEKGIV
jgi:hypothetical protein